MRPDVTPLQFDLSSLVQRSVASLYSHLVTRPTGHALRLGIESQIGELGSACVSVLDFTQVVVLDYSCADEAVAKLIQRYIDESRPADVYFIARGLADQHREPIEEVLLRHRLTLVAEVEGEFTLLGVAESQEHRAWQVVQQSRRAAVQDVASKAGLDVGAATAILRSLARRRVLVERDDGDAFFSLTALLPGN